MNLKYKISLAIIATLISFVAIKKTVNPPGVEALDLNKPISCSIPTNPEFNSLRPYPGETCTSQTASYASFCGNQLILRETLTETYPGDGDCTTNGDTVTCNFDVTVKPHTVTINLSGANLPIMGNTEDVLNSQDATEMQNSETLSDTDKVNGYVSWYLNGVINRAEYGGTKNTDYNLVNLSGPIQKLLPDAILEEQRIKTIDNVTNETSHDQIVACASNNFGVIGNLFGIGHYTPIPCYTSDGAQAQGKTFRLKATPNPLTDNLPIVSEIFSGEFSFGWDDTITWIRSIGNYITGGLRTLLDQLVQAFPPPISTISQNTINMSVSGAWNKAIPPLPWDFSSNVLYQKAYNEWRGRTCVVVPIIDYLACFENFFIPNKYADFFPYIPLAGTEDVKGGISVDSVSSASSVTTNGVSVQNITFSNQTPSTLFFSHMEESNEEASLLQSTYVAKGQNKVSSPTDISDTTCNTVDVRSNKGDNLFATQLSGDLGYRTKFSCDFKANNSLSHTAPGCSTLGGMCFDSGWSCGTLHGNADCGSGYVCGTYCSPPVQSCTKDIYVALSTKVSVPEIDNIWSRLVAGSMSVFKRIFPKTNVVNSVGTIIDIPGSTSITYSGTGVSQDSTNLNLPHLGGIYEYFLKGIQTALRPKGYGESIEFAQTTVNSCTDKTFPSLPSGKGACTLKSSDTIPGLSTAMPPTLKAILEAAGQSYNVPPSLILGVMYGEGAFRSGRYDWTEDNVRTWSTGCATMPSCDPNTFSSQGPVPFFGNYWNNLKDAVKVIDSKRTPNPCNLMDVVFALAKDLASDKNGSGGSDGLEGKTCYDIKLNPGTTKTNSCSWTPNDIETAIRVWEFGTLYSNTCGTKSGGCSKGGYNTACDGDTCEKVGGSGNTSNNACVWNVANSY